MVELRLVYRKYSGLYALPNEQHTMSFEVRVCGLPVPNLREKVCVCADVFSPIVICRALHCRFITRHPFVVGFLCRHMGQEFNKMCEESKLFDDYFPQREAALAYVRSMETVRVLCPRKC